MKRQFAILLFGCTTCGTAFGVTLDWWIRDTICQINDTHCYPTTTMGIDFDSEDSWDYSGNCRGKKYICPDALTDNSTDRVAMERAAIAHRDGINSDFDTEVYVASEQCYGARKTSQNGAMVLVNGEYKRVWCMGVLGSDYDGDDILRLTNGDVVKNGAEPTCSYLADMNYVATLDGNCYGKYYDPSRYSIDCDGQTPVIVVLNGAQYTPNVDNYITPLIANTRFSAMQTSAAAQRAIHFPQ